MAFLPLLVAYGLVALGLYWGLRRVGVRDRLLIRLLIGSVPVLLGSVLALALIEMLTGELWHSAGYVLTGVFSCGFFVAAGFGTAVYVNWRHSDVHKRGTRLIDGDNGSKKRHSRSTALTLAGQPVEVTDESKHFKMIGTTGTGKSTAIRELMTAALLRSDRALIADPDGSYTERFYDPARGDVILNPFDPRAARWDLFSEIIQPHDADQLARSLIPDYEGSDRNWRHYARTFLTAILRQLHRAHERDIAKLYWLLLLAPADELRELLDGTPAAPFLGSDNGKFFDSVRSVTAVHVAAIEHVARQTTGPALSVRKWVLDGKGVLFLPYRASEIAALRQIISSWMRLGIFQTLDLPESDRKIWFVVDELDALGAIDGLKDALARLRKFGGRCVLGFQSIAQVRGTYGDAEAQTIVENCGNSLILRCSASERGGTAEFASRLIGKREIIRRLTSRSRSGLFSGSPAVDTDSDQHTTEDAVLASEIEQLPDLEGFLKFASRPEWLRVGLRSR